MADVIKNRYEFVILFDVENGNPNGDPDAGNMPRMDQETGHGIVTDVCLKRKIRNYVEIACEDQEGYRIYVKERVPLERNDTEAFNFLGIQKNKDCGQVRGPVQIGFARSIDPIIPQEIGITRVTHTTEADAEAKDAPGTMGRKYIVPYGLYKVEGYVSANLARRVTGFTEEDLKFLWTSIINMFEHDHSAARGKMTVRELIVFKHDSELGNAPAHKLFETVLVQKKSDEAVPRSYDDYEVCIHEDKVPAGVTCMRMI